MRPSILHSAALGLAGLRAADASVSSGVSTIASTTLITLETTSSGFASESSALSSTIVSASAQVTTGVDTTTTDATTKSASTTETIITVAVTSTDGSNTEGTSTTETTIVAESVYSTVVPTTTDTTTSKADTTAIEATSTTIESASASTEVTSTAELAVTTQTTASAETTATSGTTSITDTTTAPTSIHSTTTTEATTTTAAELPAITDFQLRGARAPVEGASIYSNRLKGNYLFFSGSFPGYTSATFRVEATSGRLLIDNSLAVCAFFEADKDVASLTICRDPLGSQQIAISCTPPAKEGDVLSCSVPDQTCVATPISFFEVSTTCTPTGEMLTDTSTNFIYGVNQNIPVMGKITNGVNFVIHAV